MIRKAFENRSARVIAFSRAALALAFLISVWSDPDRNYDYFLISCTVLLAYVVVALIALALVWNDWWRDYRLRPFLSVIDITVFLVTTLLTELPNHEFVSPFLGFFAFLVFSADQQGSTRRTAVLSVAITLAYVLEIPFMMYSMAVYNIGLHERRVVYIVIVALIIVWYRMHQRRLQPERLHYRYNGSIEHLMSAVAHYAMGQSRAAGAALIWVPDDEPWTCIARAGSLGTGFERQGPLDYAFDNLAERGAILFDRRRNVALVLSPDFHLRAKTRPDLAILADTFAIDAGIILPVRTAVGNGAILLHGIAGICSDDLELGLGLAHEAESAIERYAVLNQARDTAASHIRDSIARDLHDSIAQTLAGASYRLDAVLAGIKSGHDPVAKVEAIRNDLRNEQLHVRGLIDRLREHRKTPLHSDLTAELHLALGETARQWRVDAEANISTGLEPIPTSLVHEVLQIVREAVANAARHGGALAVTVNVEGDDGMLHIAITDDGQGFPESDSPPNPRSIGERVQALGGNLAIDTRPGYTQLRINLPLGAQA